MVEKLPVDTEYGLIIAKHVSYRPERTLMQPGNLLNPPVHPRLIDRRHCHSFGSVSNFFHKRAKLQNNAT